MNGDPYKYVTEQQVRDDLHAAMAQDFAALHRKEERLQQGSSVAFVVIAGAAVTLLGVALVVSAWVF